jgi:hypothetical protein
LKEVAQRKHAAIRDRHWLIWKRNNTMEVRFVPRDITNERNSAADLSKHLDYFRVQNFHLVDVWHL